MTTLSLQFQNRGNQADYVLGTREDWGAFDVVRWHAVEEISRPFELDITLLRDAALGPVDLDGLLDSGATFRIASQGRWRAIHGILAEAEEIDRTATLLFYRVLLVPHLWRARYRRRCRNFVGRSIKEIVTAVLENRSPAHPGGHLGLAEMRGIPNPTAATPNFQGFREPLGRYRWSVGDESRITDRTITPYVAQYNESDLDFVSRLLEREGLSYYFEHTDQAPVMTITDAPGQAPLFDTDETFTQRGVSQSGQIGAQEVVRSLRDARRMRARAVTMRDYDYHRSRSGLEAEVTMGKGDEEAAGHFEFPAGDELVQKSPGLAPATIRLERCNVERHLREGAGSVRTMEVGYQFTLQDGDHLRSDVDLLAVRVETFAVQLAPAGTVLDEEPFGFAGAPPPVAPSHQNQFLALPVATPFRPAMRTPRPQIHGIQTAMVTAEELAGQPRINTDELGCVRVRFPWDQRAADEGTPSSHWIRVSQYWAGAGFGALYTPRVGHEVLVAYLQGDPDQPVIVGRVYNAQSPPPYDPSERPTVSTVKSDTSPVGPGSNELRFEDLTGKEEVFLHAQRDLNEVVVASHSTSVGGDQSNSVGGNQSNSVGRNRTHTVQGTESVTVAGNRTTSFGADETHIVTGERTTVIGPSDGRFVQGLDSVEVTGARTVKVGADHEVTAGGNYTSTAASNHTFTSTNTYFYPAGDFQVDSTTAGFNQESEFYAKAAGASIRLSAGMLLLDNGAGASIALVGGLVLIRAGGSVRVVTSGPMSLKAGGDINAMGATIKLNG